MHAPELRFTRNFAIQVFWPQSGDAGRYVAIAMDDSPIERRLIGLMLLEGANISRVIRAGITAPTYQHAPHSELHTAIVDAAIDADGQVDAITLASHLHDQDRLEATGGVQYIAQILDSVRTSDRITDLARQLRT